MSKDRKCRQQLVQLDKADLTESHLRLEKRLATLEEQRAALKQAFGQQRL